MSEEIKQEQKPEVQSFWQQFYKDIHTNSAGICMFGFGAAAIIWPEHKDKFEDLAALAATYLFASVKGNKDK